MAVSTDPPCIIGEYCHRHGFEHGAEAEEFRERITKLVNSSRGSGHLRHDLLGLLDEVDARDSLAWLERKAPRV